MIDHTEAVARAQKAISICGPGCSECAKRRRNATAAIEMAVSETAEACAQLALQSPFPFQAEFEADPGNLLYAVERAGYCMATRAIAEAIRSRITVRAASTQSPTESPDPAD
jgi:4-hydroxyphenylpyruvate dioxygenase-like putative hemolysin